MLSERACNVIGVTRIALCVCALTMRVDGQTPPAGATLSQPPVTPATLPGDDVSLSMAATSEEPPGIVWGAGHDVQAGLRVRLWAGDQHASRFVFDVYIRNRTKHSLNITCPSFTGLSVPSDAEYGTEVQSTLIYCTPHLRDSNGRSVGVGVRPGTENRQYTVGAGQVIYVSHWMLRTMSRRAKASPRVNYTQVAFVAPGKHRVICDVSASISSGNKGGQWLRLRTGEVKFDVTEADIARE